MRRTNATAWRGALLAAVLASLQCGAPHRAAGCAFDGAFDASIALPHAGAIPVTLAVRRAVADGVLPRAALDPIVAGSDGLWRAAARLEELRGRLSQAAVRTGRRIPFVVLLGDAELWTRERPAPAGYASEIHASPAREGETIVLSEQSVLTALLDGGVSAEAAFDRGLVAIDAPEREAKELRELLIETFAARPAPASAQDSLASRIPWRTLTK